MTFPTGVIQGDVIDVLDSLPSAFVMCSVSSPPYWALRDYGLPKRHWPEVRFRLNEWSPEVVVPAMACCLGLEPDPVTFVGHLVLVYRSVRRVLRNDGLIWVNLGDSFAKAGGSGNVGVNSQREGRTYRQGNLESKSTGGLKAGDLCGIPWLFAQAMRADGWYFRGDSVWCKRSPMPESVTGWHWVKHKIRVDESEYSTLQKMFSQSPDAGVHDQIGSDVHYLQKEISSPKSYEILQNGKRQTCEKESGQKESKESGPIKKEEASSSAKVSNRRELQKERGGSPEKVEANASRASLGSRQGSSEKSTKTEFGGDSYERRMGPNRKEEQGDLSLLQEENRSPYDGSCDSAFKRRNSRGNECRYVVPFLQLEKTGKDRNLVLVDCPGCSKCSANDGYVLRRGNWRHTRAHEYVFQFAKSAKAFSDAQAVAEPTTGNAHSRGKGTNPKAIDNAADSGNKQNIDFSANVAELVTTRNPRSFYVLSTEPSKEKHFAAYPKKLILPFIKASVSANGYCGTCGAPIARVIEKRLVPTRPGLNPKQDWRADNYDELAQRSPTSPNRDPERHVTETITLGWRPTCQCQSPTTYPGIVLDPFTGTGTTGVVAKSLGFEFLGTELNPQYCEIANRRISAAGPGDLIVKSRPAKTAKPLDGQRELFS